MDLNTHKVIYCLYFLYLHASILDTFLKLEYIIYLIVGPASWLDNVVNNIWYMHCITFLKLKIMNSETSGSRISDKAF